MLRPICYLTFSYLDPILVAADLKDDSAALDNTSSTFRGQHGDHALNWKSFKFASCSTTKTIAQIFIYYPYEFLAVADLH